MPQAQQQMNDTSKFNRIENPMGIRQFVLTDQSGRIVAQKKTQGPKLGQMVSKCGQLLTSIGRSGFEHALLKRKNHCDILVFTIGKYYLGVLKEPNMENRILIKTIKHFLADIQVK